MCYRMFKHKKKMQINRKQWWNVEWKKFKESLEPTKLSVDELKKAETEIIHACQAQCFVDEIATSKKGNSHVKKDSSIFKLDPEMDQGALRVGGRLSRMAMPDEVKHPAILPSKHHVSRLILGRNHMLSVLRQKFWIPWPWVVPFLGQKDNFAVFNMSKISGKHWSAKNVWPTRRQDNTWSTSLYLGRGWLFWTHWGKARKKYSKVLWWNFHLSCKSCCPPWSGSFFRHRFLY